MTYNVFGGTLSLAQSITLIDQLFLQELSASLNLVGDDQHIQCMIAHSTCHPGDQML